jgi:endonuclease G
MKKWFASLLFAVAAHAIAAPSSCTDFTPNAQWPVLANARMAPKTRIRASRMDRFGLQNI